MISWLLIIIGLMMVELSCCEKYYLPRTEIGGFYRLNDQIRPGPGAHLVNYAQVDMLREFFNKSKLNLMDYPINHKICKHKLIKLGHPVKWCFIVKGINYYIGEPIMISYPDYCSEGCRMSTTINFTLSTQLSSLSPIASSKNHLSDFLGLLGDHKIIPNEILPAKRTTNPAPTFNLEISGFHPNSVQFIWFKPISLIVFGQDKIETIGNEENDYYTIDNEVDTVERLTKVTIPLVTGEGKYLNGFYGRAEICGTRNPVQLERFLNQVNTPNTVNIFDIKSKYCR